MMNEELDEFENEMRATIGTAPEPNFLRWKAAHPDAVASLQQTQPVILRSKSIWQRLSVARLATAAAVLVAVGITALSFFGSKSYALEGPILGVDDVQKLTWVTTFFENVKSKDGSESWVESERRTNAYQHPGRYRVDAFDRAGKPTWTRIKNFSENSMVVIDHLTKEVTKSTPDSQEGLAAPFTDVGLVIRDRKTIVADLYVKSVTLGNATTFDGQDANPITAKFGSTERSGVIKQVYFLAPKSKQLLGIFQPKDPNLEMDKLVSQVVANDSPKLKQAWSYREPIGALVSEINASPTLDDKTFELAAPEGYKMRSSERPTIHQDELLQYLAACAKLNDNKLPDSLIGAYDSDKINEQWAKDESARTHEANAVIAWIDRFRMREIYQSPMLRYLEDNAIADTFGYVGSGIEVGDSKRIVAWYQGKSDQKWFGLFADLKIREITKDEIPVELNGK